MPDTARYRYHRGDYDGINQELNSIDWDSQLADKNTEESWAYFADAFNNAMRKFIPKGHRKKVKKKKLWMTKDATRQQKKKYHAWKRFTETGAYADQLVARKEALALTHLTTRLRRSFEKDIAKNAKKNPKAFWRYCSTQMKTKAVIGDLAKQDGELTSGNREKAEVMNTFFSSVFTDENLDNMPSLAPREWHSPNNFGDHPREDKEKAPETEKDKICGPWRFSSQGSTGMCWRHLRSISGHLQEIPTRGNAPPTVEGRTHHPNPQEREPEAARKLSPSQPDLSHWQNNGIVSAGRDRGAHDEKQPLLRRAAWIRSRAVLYDPADQLHGGLVRGPGRRSLPWRNLPWLPEGIWLSPSPTPAEQSRGLRNHWQVQEMADRLSHRTKAKGNPRWGSLGVDDSKKPDPPR